MWSINLNTVIVVTVTCSYCVLLGVKELEDNFIDIKNKVPI